MCTPGAIADQVFGWLDHHNGAITAIATAMLAILTGVLAVLNERLLRASTKATEAAQRAAKAAEDQAKAGRDAMELEWRPVLTFHHATESETLGTTGISVPYSTTYVRNVGRGPALLVSRLVGSGLALVQITPKIGAMLEFGPASEKELRNWTYAHNDGIVLVKAGPNLYRIHRATCMHIFWIEKGLRTAAQPRYCFEGEDDARRWAWRTHHGQIVSCQTCLA